jgi:hypothetical protein
VDWYRDPTNQAEARFALNAALLLDDYAKPREGQGRESYDATLTICVFQALLTNCTELLQAMNKADCGDFKKGLPETKPDWGFAETTIDEWNFGQPSLYRALVNMRNGLSHPLPRELSPEIMCSGFTAIAARPAGPITSVRIKSAPWVDKGRRVDWVTARCREDAEEILKRQLKKFRPVAGELKVLEMVDGTFDLGVAGSQFQPHFVINFPLDGLKSLARHLSLWLAQTVNGLRPLKVPRPLEELVSA